LAAAFAGSVDRYAAETARVGALLLRSMAVDLGVAPERLLEEAFRGLPQSMRTTYCWTYALEPTAFDLLVDSDGFDPL
jgi:hypothetical protein